MSKTFIGMKMDNKLSAFRGLLPGPPPQPVLPDCYDLPL